jgi:hypothetical protein
MNRFESLYKKLLESMANTASTAFSAPFAQPAGQYGNQFPSQTDAAYAPGDSRLPKILGAKKRRGKKLKMPIQRRKLTV